MILYGKHWVDIGLRKLYLVRVNLGQNFTVWRFRSLFLCFCYIFCVFNGESIEVGYKNLIKWTLGGWSATFKPYVGNLNFDHIIGG